MPHAQNGDMAAIVARLRPQSAAAVAQFLAAVDAAENGRPTVGTLTLSVGTSRVGAVEAHWTTAPAQLIINLNQRAS